MRVIVLALGVVVAAQQTPPPTFQSATDLVQVDVVVHDKGGRPVLDLAPGDFEVREEGKPQSVEQFYLVRGGSAVAGSPVLSTPDAAPNVGTRPLRRVFVVVFDTDHLTTAGFKRARDAATTLFSKEFRNGDLGGVVSDGQLANKRLTSNREELLADLKTASPNSRVRSAQVELREWPTMNEPEALQIARYGLQNDQYLEEVVRRACADDPDACRREPPEPDVYQKALRITTYIRASSDQTLHTLSALMTGLQSMDGRKTILLLSEGFIADESWPIVQQAVALAARANARIYSLDARGLDRARGPIGDYAPHDDTLGNLLASFDIGADSINSLAVDTGGFVVRNTNIFDQAVGEIAAEAGTFYVLGYRSALPADGKFHKISVSVKRGGLSVRARRGFVATSKPPAVATEARSTAAPERAGVAGAEPAEPRAPATAPTDVAPMLSATTAGATPTPATDAIVTGAASTAGFRLRPDAGKHVDLLLKNDAAANDAAKTGWEAYQRGDVATAKNSLQIAAADPGSRPWVHYALGMSEYALRDFHESATEWEAVRRTAPEFEPVYFDLVDSYLQLKDHDRAIQVLHAARDRWPKDPEVLNALGVVQTSRGAIDDAVRSFQEAVTLTPNDHVSRYNLGRALEMRYNRTRRYVQQLRAWVSNERDRDDAIDNYRACIAIGGPFVEAAQAGLTRLEWTAKPDP